MVVNLQAAVILEMLEGQEVVQGRPGNYGKQARTYDLTRGASPTLVRLLARLLAEAGGRSLIDIAGGTGNYTHAMQARGFDVRIVDAEAAMVERSVEKIGPGRQVVGDALALPLRDESFDCAMLTQALHLLAPQATAFREARRVLRRGPYLLQAFTKENLRHAFIFEYFPGSHPPEAMHPPAGAIAEALRDAGFSRVDLETYLYLDTADANLHALHSDPMRLAGPAYLRNTSFYQRLPEHVRKEGLARLAADLRSGELEKKAKASFEEAVTSGHGTVFSAWP